MRCPVRNSGFTSLSSGIGLFVPLLLLLSLLIDTSHAATVAVPVEAVLGQDEETPEKPAVGWVLSHSLTEVRPDGELTRIRTTLVIDAIDEPVWVELLVLDGSVMLEDEAGLERRDSHWWFTGKVTGTRKLVVEGLLPNAVNAIALTVTPAVRQQVVTVGEGLDFVVDGQVDGFLPPTARLRVNWSPEGAAPVRREVLQATVATAAWYDEDDLAIRSKVRFSVRRGAVSRFTLQLPAGLREVEVRAPGATWQLSGNTLVLVTEKPVEGALDVTVEGRLPFSAKKATLSQLKPQGVSSTSWTMTLAGTSDALLSPSVSGLHPTALSALPPDARSIGDAPATAGWTGGGTLMVTALQLQSVDGPALVVDRARCTQASSSGGRAMLRCSLDVRNASAQYLRIQAPEGMTLWNARVNGEGVAPVASEPWTAVPLERSIETLAGLTQLDVDLVFIAEDEAWERKGERGFSLPAFDAPVAVLEWELRLPPGYRAEVEGGSVSTARPADAEIVYAYASTDLKQDKEQARETWNQALDAYQDNDFQVAQAYVDETLALDPGNENALALQSNLDVFSGADEGQYETVEEEAMSRRVKDTAKAKVAYKEVEESTKLEEADRLMAKGDYELAEKAYEEAAEISEELAQYDQIESNENAYRSNESRKKAAEAREQKSNRAPAPRQEVAVSQPVRSDSWGGEEVYDSRNVDALESGAYQDGLLGATGRGEVAVDPAAAIVMDYDLDGDELIFDDYEEYERFGEIDFEGVEVSGELVQAQGAVTGNGGLAQRGSGVGGGGNAEGLGGLGTKGRGSGASGYGAGGGNFGDTGGAPAPPEEPVMVYEPETAAPMAAPEPDDDYYWEDEPDYAVAQVTVTGIYAVGGALHGATNENLPPAPPPRDTRTRDSTSTVTTTPVVVASNRPDLHAQPALSATTWGIPLPEHGESVVLTQRLLAPGESPTVTVKYRETR